jgi:signal transduction histidine kinase
MGWRRLYLQIYLTIIASLALVVLLLSLSWVFVGRDQIDKDVFEVIGRLAYLSLPAANAPLEQQAEAVTRMGRELEIDISLYDQNRQLLTAIGPVLDLPDPGIDRARWRWTHKGRVWALHLPDGRWLAVNHDRHDGPRPLFKVALFCGILALGVALGAYPFVRRLTRRLERLQKGVERIGAGDLTARVEVQGRDEIAALAESFNIAAAQIENLIEAHRLLLANASHELRTPLSRIRMGIELLSDGDDPERKRALEQDIAELDALIDDILMMSRLDAGAHGDLSQELDFVALVAEECAQFTDCVLTGQAPGIQGDPRLLRQLVQNLLQNALNHGVPPIDVDVSDLGDVVLLTIRDHGDGITEADREKVFQPFFRAKHAQNKAGYGLGLPLARRIVEAHGGTIDLVPQAQARSAIAVKLPRRQKS